MPEITTVFLDFTTACNLSCPNCCCRIPERKGIHYPYSYFAELAGWIYGIDRVDLTGGEPTCHPQFAEFVPRLKALFGCRLLTMETNCFKAREYIDIFDRFDFIRLGRYQSNTEEVDWVMSHHRSAWQQNNGACVETADPVDENNHVSIDRRGSGQLCTLESIGEHVIYTDGKFYPCRLGLAVPGAVGIEPCEDWRQKVMELPIPCWNCHFSPDENRAVLGFPKGSPK
jgi:hypothetical protein